MSAGRGAALLGATALALSAAALGAGAVAAFLASPVAVGLVALALRLRRGVGPRDPRWIVAGGLLAALLGLALAGLAGSAAGLAAGILGLGSAWAGTALALAASPPPATAAPALSRGAGVAAAVAADELCLLLWDLRSSARPSAPLRRVVADLHAAAERNRAAGILERPERAHPPPPPLEKPRIETRSVPGAGRVEHLRFESAYEPLDPEIRDDYLAQPANRTAHVWLWRHADGPRPTLVCVHGYGMGRVGLDARAWDVERLHRRLGLDVAAVVLPLHGARSLVRRSGSGFLDVHPLWTNAALGQAVWELRRLAGWLRAEGAPAIGVYGMSLGGYIAALFASLHAGLACALPYTPVVSLPALLRRDRSERESLAAEAFGAGGSLLEAAWAPHALLRHAPRVPREGRLIVAGLADRICPPEQALALWEHWERPALHWFPGSHLVARSRRALRERVDRHLAEQLAAAARRPPLTRFRG